MSPTSWSASGPTMLILPDRRSCREMSRDWAEEPVGRPDSGGLDLGRGARTDRRSPSRSRHPGVDLRRPHGPGLPSSTSPAASTPSAPPGGWRRHTLAMAELNDAAARATDAEGLVEAAPHVHPGRRARQHHGWSRPTTHPCPRGPPPPLALADGRRTAYAGPEGPDHVAELPVPARRRAAGHHRDDLAGPPSTTRPCERCSRPWRPTLSGALDRLSQRDRLRRPRTASASISSGGCWTPRTRSAGSRTTSTTTRCRPWPRSSCAWGSPRPPGSRGDPRLVPAFAAISPSSERVMVGLRTLLFELEPVSTSTALIDVVSEVLASLPIEGRPCRTSRSTGRPCPGARPGLLDLPQHLRQARPPASSARRCATSRPRPGELGLSRRRPGPRRSPSPSSTTASGSRRAETARSAPGHRGSRHDGPGRDVGGWCRLDRESDRTVLRFWLPPARPGPGPGARAHLTGPDRT